MSASTPAAAAVDAARALHAEARLTNERRALVLAGPPGWTAGAARSVLDTVDLPIGNTTVVGERSPLDCETLRPPHADHLLGTTRAAVVVDCHDGPHPDALGRAVGAVDGGGLLLLLTPPLDAWPSRSVPDDPLAVPPHDPGDVGGRFVARLARTLRDHRGVGIVEASTGVECDGLTDPAPRLDGSGGATASNDTGFPAAAYDRCLTADQAGGLDALSALQNREGDRCAVVVEADRGRGKSSVAGIAAACLAADGDDVCVTAPDRSGVAPLFDRAKETLAALGALGRGQDDGTAGAVAATAGGRVRFVAPDAVADVDPDALIVDEAAAIPVPTLESYLSVDRLAFVTTVHGYEGTGRGFDVRFRGRLADDRPVTDCRLVTPIRYAPADPVEVWAFRALALNARPAVDPLVADADPDGVAYRAPAARGVRAARRRPLPDGSGRPPPAARRPQHGRPDARTRRARRRRRAAGARGRAGRRDVPRLLRG
jgi:tRNA(Met) cytidine acetyltransferase